MYVRRKNCEYSRIKRSSRKPKPCDTFSNNFGSYLKLFLIWSSIMVLDFLMEFRFEYMWPCWLLIRTINDSFKYQGMAFAVFFTLIALTSDLICYLLVPSSWLFLFGSTCVWIELVWHAERGVCVPTVAMCFLFLYVEVAVRLRDPKTIPLSVDLCRPFAAHCIGYPVVTLGFGLKSLLSHHLRLRRQHYVKTQNSKYFCLLELALPEESRSLYRRGELANGQLPAPSTPNAITGNLPVSAAAATTTLAVTTASTTSTTSVVSTSSKSSRKQQQQQQQQQQSLTAAKPASSAANCDHSLEVRSAPNHAAADRKFFGGYDGTDHSHHQHHHTQQLKESSEYSPCCEAPAISSSSSSLSGQEVALEARLSSSSSSGATKRSVATTTANTSATSPPPPPPPPSQCNAATSTTTVATSTTAAAGKAKTSDKSSRAGKDASVYRLEDELRKLRHERQSMLVTESELRAQVTQLTTLERTSRTETSQARQEIEHLQSKLSTVTQRLQTERENLQVAEKKAAEEKRQRAALEVSLAAEKRARKEAELALKAAPTPALFGTATASTTNPSTTPPAIGSKASTTKPGVVAVGANRAPAGIVSRCTSEACAHRMHDLEAQVKALSRELAMKEAQLIAASQSNRAASPPTCSPAYAIERQQKMLLKQQSSEQSHRIADLMLHLGDLEAENARLKATLKAEDKMKQELLAGYHTSLKEITELNSTLTRKEYQIVELNMRLDLMNPNGPYSYMLGAGVGAEAPGADGRGGGHQRAPTGYMNGVGGGGGSYGESGGGGSLFPPRSTDADFDFGGGGGWPTFPTTSASSSVVFSDHHHHQQQQQQHHRLRSDSTSAVLNVLLNAREDKPPIHASQPPPPPHLQRFDTGVVDLEAASNSLSPPEFLSKLRSQLAMAGGSVQQPAPISPPSRDTVSGGGGGGGGGSSGGGGGGGEVLSDGPTRTSSGTTAESADSDPSGGGEVVGGTGTVGD